MKSEAIQHMHHQFNALAQTVPDSDIEFWFARDLQEPVGKFPDGDPSGGGGLRNNRL